MTSRFLLSCTVFALLWVASVCVWSEAEANGGGRRVLLQGTRNTRELGGIRLARGEVRRGCIYRSGALCFLTPDDVEKLLGLPVHTIIDLRTRKEIDKDGPDRPALVSGVGQLVYLPMTNSRGLGREAYELLMVENAAALRALFELMAKESSYPILFHCSAGKDRTGIVSALVLELLGASREVIMDDYLESLRNSPRLKVHPDWLNEVFLAVDREGGIEPYLLKQGITRECLEQVRERLIRLPD